MTIACKLSLNNLIKKTAFTKEIPISAKIYSHNTLVEDISNPRSNDKITPKF